jgi:AAA15 family ATPase/GTPase
MIKDFSIKNLANVKELSVQNLSNINVLIGENDTGKTMILKFYIPCQNQLKILIKVMKIEA